MEGYIGEVREFAGHFAPHGWASCDGQMIRVKDYPALFSIIGTMYGGNGTEVFALPDWRYEDGEGRKVHGWDIGKPSKIICVDGHYPERP